jgi:AraC family transcriptional regulator, regulatory protein of adaptative response / methylated-DNA-[protein]-cysteine methyltransferase
MNQNDERATARDYRLVEAAIRFLEAEWRRQPTLEEAAAAAGLSPFHFQRTFVRWAGVSPKRFVQLLTLADARARLRHGETVLAASYGAGLSGPGRLHDLSVSFDALTPGEVRARGAGLTIRHGVGETLFGTGAVAWNERGVCALRFLPEGVQDAAAELAAEWPQALLLRDDAGAGALFRRIFERRADGAPPAAATPLRLLVRATPFQLHVWRALVAVPEGDVTTYGRIAEALGRPTASRAVGQAIGSNPVAWVVPCHRVIRTVPGLGSGIAGGLGGYRWGTPRKAAMLGWEAARTLRHEEEAESRLA